MGFIGISHIHHTFLRSVNQLLGGAVKGGGGVGSFFFFFFFGKVSTRFCGLMFH